MFQRITDDRVFRVTFLLLPKFSLMAFASAVEPLRVANRMQGKSLYSWSLVSPDGAPESDSVRSCALVTDNTCALSMWAAGPESGGQRF